MLNDRIKSTGDLERNLVLVERMLLKCPNDVRLVLAIPQDFITPHRCQSSRHQISCGMEATEKPHTSAAVCASSSLQRHTPTRSRHQPEFDNQLILPKLNPRAKHRAFPGKSTLTAFNFLSSRAMKWSLQLVMHSYTNAAPVVNLDTSPCPHHNRAMACHLPCLL